MNSNLVSIDKLKRIARQKGLMKYIKEIGYSVAKNKKYFIKTIDDKFVGVMGLDYTKRKTKLDIEAINHLAVHASSIGGVLMSH